MLDGRPSWTARWVATQRAAYHDSRPAHGDAAAELRLYQDLKLPLLGRKMAAPTAMAARTGFVDDQLVEAVERGTRQVVLLGAGYDGRPLRFSEAPVAWFEVDHPATQADKIRRLTRAGATTDHIAFVSVDLLDGDLDAELDKAGHRPTLSTLWVCEGLLPYLSSSAIGALFRTLRARSDDESELVCNVLVRPEPTRSARVVRQGLDLLLAAIGERRLSEFQPGAIEGLLAGAGWDVVTHRATRPGRADGSYMLALTATPSQPGAPPQIQRGTLSA